MSIHRFACVCCDGCGRCSPEAPDANAAEELAASYGWQAEWIWRTDVRIHLCARCGKKPGLWERFRQGDGVRQEAS